MKEKPEGIRELERLESESEEDPENVEKWLRLGRYAVERYITGLSERALVNAVQLAPDDPQVLGELGKALNRKRKLSEAMRVYEHALEADSEDPSLWTGLGVVKSHLMEPEAASECFEKALSLDPGYPWAISSLRAMMEHVSPGIDLVERFREAVQASPDKSLNWALLGHDLERQGNTAEALQAIENALRFFKNANPDDQRRIVLLLSNTGSRNQVYDLAKEVLRTDPTRVGLSFALATAYLGERRFEDVDRLLAIGLQFDPENQMLHNLRMLCLMESGNLLEALAMQEDMKKERPEDPLMRVMDVWLARPRTVSGQTTEQIRSILNRFPTDSIIRAELAHRLVREGQHSAAIATILEGAHLEYSRPEEHFRYAVSALGFGLRREAEFHISKGMELGGDSLESRAMLALQLVHNTQYDDLEAVVQDILGKFPGAKSWYAVLGILEKMRRKVESAEMSIRCAADEGMPYALIELFQIEQRKGNAKMAERLLEDFVATFEDNDRLAGLRSWALAGLGRVDEALHLLKETTRRFPLDFESWAVWIALSGRTGDLSIVREVVNEYHITMKPFRSDHSVIDKLQDFDDVLEGRFEAETWDSTLLCGAVEYLVDSLQK